MYVALVYNAWDVLVVDYLYKLGRLGFVCPCLPMSKSCRLAVAQSDSAILSLVIFRLTLLVSG